MTALALVEGLTAAGVALTVESGRLVIDGPESALTDEVLSELASRKGEVLTLLARPATPPSEPADGPPPLIPWSELRHQRWGPAVGDPAPGLTVPRGRVRHPFDPEAERAAREDRDAVIERACIRSEKPGGRYEEPPWVEWARGLTPDAWQAARDRAEAVRRRLPDPAGIAALEAAWEAVWRQATGESSEDSTPPSPREGAL